MIAIPRAGLFSSVQDLGRTGHRALGVGQGGALDTLALRVANRLVGNPDHAAGIEMTVGRPMVLRFNAAARIALTGADCAATLDGQPVHAWWSHTVNAGQTLTLGMPPRGMRAYLGVSGGIDVPLLLGSRSTDLKAGFGGLEGRALRDGDILPVGTLQLPAGSPVDADARAHADVKAGMGTDALTTAPGTAAVAPSPAALAAMRAAVAIDAPAFGIKPPSWCRFAHVRPAQRASREYPRTGAEAQRVRVLRGPEYSSFTPAAHDALWNAEWRVTPDSNRMGYRLAGPALVRGNKDDLLSHAVLPGTLQVPPGGQPILLMGDAQTSGGYPRIAVVITGDLWQLAQVRLNTPLRFIECSHADANVVLQDIEAYLAQIDLAIRLQGERCLPG